MFIDTFSGNIGVGNTSPTLAKFQVKGSIFVTGTDNTFLAVDDQASPRVGFAKKSGFSGMFMHSNNANFAIGMSNTTSIDPNAAAFTSVTQQFVIDTSGRVGIGTSTPATTLSVSGNDYITGGEGVGILNTAAGTLQTTGNATIGGCVNYNGGTSGTCLSDERVKQDINPYTDGLQEIIALNPVTYQYNGLAGTPNDGDVRTGLIAQQVQLVAPDLVSTTSAMLNPTDTTPTQLLEVNYSALTFALINAVKEIASISGTFETNLVAWLGNASNGITQFFADTITANKQLCAKKSDGTPVCVTGDQLAALLAGNGNGGNQSPSAAQPSPAATSSLPESVT